MGINVAVFSTKLYDRAFLDEANERAGAGHTLTYFEPRLVAETAPLAAGFGAVCAFVNDRLDRGVLELLARGGTRLLALRSAGFNHVDLRAAGELDIAVTRVPAYSPHAVAEHAVALMLALNRSTHRAYNRVREGNFALHGLLGFDLYSRTVGVVGLGKIGELFARIMLGFGCRVLASDPRGPSAAGDLPLEVVELPRLFERSDIVSLHCPLTPETHHLIGSDAVERMKRGVMIINTGRGALIDTRAVIAGLKSGKVGYLGIDVYEEEEALFYEDHSHHVIQDDLLMRLVTFPNVLVTAHQGFFTREALQAIADTTIENLSAFEAGRPLVHAVGA